MSHGDSTGILYIDSSAYSRLRRMGIFVLVLNTLTPTTQPSIFEQYEPIGRCPVKTEDPNRITYGPPRKGKQGKTKRW